MTAYTIYRCPVDGQLYAEVPGLAIHPGLAAVRYFATSPSSPEAKRCLFWARVLRDMEQRAAAAPSPEPTTSPTSAPGEEKRDSTPAQ